MIHLRILFFAKARELAEVSEAVIAFPEGKSVKELRDLLIQNYPKLSGFLDLCAVAIDDEFSSDAQRIQKEATVAILPPVSGG
jgi:molybdopterin synthase catalytic subunit